MPSSLVNRFCEKDTVRSGNSERPNFICPGALSISHKSAQTSQLPLSAVACAPFCGFRLCVLRDFPTAWLRSLLEHTTPIANKNVIVEINRKFINFASMFKTYLDYYEVQVKQIYGVESKELKEFKKKCSKIFDKHFEYRFLYNLRHYCVHYKLPITKVSQNIDDKRRIFYIEKKRLKEWKGWKPIIKSDIQNLNEDIDIKLFITKIEKILNDLNRDISYYNTSEVLGAIKIMKRYVKTSETPYIVNQIKDKEGKSNFEIKNMMDDYFLATNNILKLDIISCAVYNKEYGFQFFDPFNMMFTKEEKEKFGLE